MAQEVKGKKPVMPKREDYAEGPDGALAYANAYVEYNKAMNLWETEVEAEKLAMPHVTPGEVRKSIEEASKETGVRVDTTKESKDLTRRAEEARKEAEKYLGLTRGKGLKAVKEKPKPKPVKKKKK